VTISYKEKEKVPECPKDSSIYFHLSDPLE
jgi:hypothetical protein